MIGDTIAAVSTPPGKGGVALLRVSGPGTLQVLGAVFRTGAGKALSDPEPRRAYYGTIRTPGEEEMIDDGIAVFYPAPHSFTGEDVAEITCHGGVLVTRTVLCALLCAGARQAEAGEFTRRAFLNGKLRLSEAEALGTLLDAATEQQRRLARSGLNGNLSRAVQALYDRLCTVLASIYAKIDYPDEDLADLSGTQIRTMLSEVLCDVQRLGATWQTGRAIAEGIPTVICGAANAGKSSLYNRLVGYDAAIVTDIAGTTRDVLTQTVPLGQMTLRLYDTAGLRESDDPVEKIGVARAREALEQAELILAVFDASRPFGQEDQGVFSLLADRTERVIAVLNKTDCGQDADTVRALRAHFPVCIPVSAARGDGMEALVQCVQARFLDGNLDISQDAVIANARQHAALTRCRQALEQAIRAIDDGLPTDLYCTDAEYAMQAVAEVDSRTVSEDVVSAIFSHFCVGK